MGRCARYKSCCNTVCIYGHANKACCCCCCSLETFKRTPKRYQGSVLWAWLKILFTPKKKTHILTLTNFGSMHY